MTSTASATWTPKETIVPGSRRGPPQCRRPGKGTPSSPSPRAASRTEIGAIVGISGRGVPPLEHDDALGRKTRPPMEHDHGFCPGPLRIERTGAPPGALELPRKIV